MTSPLRYALSSFFRLLFRTHFFRVRFYGFYKRVFRPLNLFKGVRKKVLFQKRIRLEIDLDDWIPQNIYFLNSYETAELNFIKNYLKTGDCFVDVGANIGLFSLTASLSVGPTGTVISFEPFDRNHAQLLNHKKLNGFVNMTVEQMALSDEAGEMDIFLDEAEKDFGMVTGFPRAYTYKEIVPKTTLDVYLAQKPLASGKLAMIKIDVEGGELPALKGMENTIKRYRPLILVEINPENYHPTPHRPADVEQFLAHLGYKKYHLDASGKISQEKHMGDNSNNFVFKYGEVPSP